MTLTVPFSVNCPFLHESFLFHDPTQNKVPQSLLQRLEERGNCYTVKSLKLNFINVFIQDIKPPVGKSLFVFWRSAWAALEPLATMDQELPHQELTEANFSFRDSCMPGRRDCTSSWLKIYPKFSWFLLVKYYSRLAVPRNILLKAQKLAFEIGEYCKQMSAWCNSTVPLCFASLGTPNFWPESSLSKTMGSPQCHVLSQVSP